VNDAAGDEIGFAILHYPVSASSHETRIPLLRHSCTRKPRQSLSLCIPRQSLGNEGKEARASIDIAFPNWSLGTRRRDLFCCHTVNDLKQAHGIPAVFLCNIFEALFRPATIPFPLKHAEVLSCPDQNRHRSALWSFFRSLVAGCLGKTSLHPIRLQLLS